MGQAIDQVMSQYGIAPSYAVGGGVKGYQTGGRSTMAAGPKLPGLPPVEADYTGTAESVGIEGAAPVKLLADYAKDKAAFDESVRKYGLERKEYDEYATAYRDRFAQYNPYNKPQYDTTGGNSPGTFYPPRDPDGIYPAVMPPVHLGKGIAYDPTPRTPRVLAPSYGAVSQFSNLTPQQMGDAYLRHRQTGYTDADIRNATARQVGAPSDELMGNIYTSAYPQYAKAITDQYAQQFNRAGFGTGANQIDRPGYNYWMNQLSGGAVTPETLASAIRGGSTPFVPTPTVVTPTDPTVVTPTDPTYEYEVNYANNARGGLVNSYNLGSNNYSHGGAIRGYAQGGEEESTPSLTKIALSFDENPEALINTLDDANTISAPLETIAYVPPTEMGNTDQPTAPQMPTDMSFGQFLANLPANIVAMFSGVNDPPGLDAAANAAAAEAVGQAASDSETGNTSGTADIGGSIWNRGGLVRGYNNGGVVGDVRGYEHGGIHYEDELRDARSAHTQNINNVLKMMSEGPSERELDAAYRADNLRKFIAMNQPTKTKSPFGVLANLGTAEMETIALQREQEEKQKGKNQKILEFTTGLSGENLRALTKLDQEQRKREEDAIKRKTIADALLSAADLRNQNQIIAAASAKGEARAAAEKRNQNQIAAAALARDEAQDAERRRQAFESGTSAALGNPPSASAPPPEASASQPAAPPPAASAGRPAAPPPAASAGQPAALEDPPSASAPPPAASAPPPAASAGQPAASAGQPAAPPPINPAGDPKGLWHLAFNGVNGEPITGAIVGAKAAGQTVLGQIGTNIVNPGVIAARQKMTNVFAEMVRALALSPRMPVYEIQRIERELNISPSMLLDQTTMLERMYAISESLKTQLASDDVASQNPQLPLKTRTEAAASVERIKTFLKTLGVPENVDLSELPGRIPAKASAPSGARSGEADIEYTGTNPEVKKLWRYFTREEKINWNRNSK